MKETWNMPITIDDAWEDAPKNPGIYVIRRKDPIKRINGVDPNGILYIGKSKRLRGRLKQFRVSYHPASGLLWEHRKIAIKILGAGCNKDDFLNKELGKLKVRMAENPSGDDLDKAERAVLFAYVLKYGETPPLNSSLPGRWKKLPSEPDLEWGKKGLK